MTCVVCETIIDVYGADFDEWDEDVLGEVSDILNSDCPHAKSIQHATNLDRPLKEFADRLLALKKEGNQTSARFGVADLAADNDVVFENISTTAMELVAQIGVQGHPGRACLPDPKWIDLNVVCEWISMCKNEHQDKCNEPLWLKGIAPVDTEWLIDVVEARIVPPPTGARYVALSYTWGLGRNLKNTKATVQELQRSGALNLPHFAAQLPQTIRDTMGLVKCLGERYLWVDALCIIQDDPRSLSQNLNQMQLIYANSTFSIMAATGCGAEVGLRGIKGVSEPRNLEMRVYELGGGDKLCAKPLTLDPTSGTKFSYHQRGWTFQEWLFSRRRLVFRYGLLEWECQCASWQEHLKPNVLADSQWELRHRNKESGLKPSPSIWDFMSMASKFNTKALTVAEDAPKAFAGIQAMLHRVHPGGLLFGLSELFFEVSLMWSSLFSDIERRGSDVGAVFQDGLPSWSWMGWQGDITFPYDAEFRLTQPWHYHEQKIGFTDQVAEWFCANSSRSGVKRLVRSGWHNYRKFARDDDSLIPLPWGWSRKQYDREVYSHDFIPSGAPPKHVYIHRSDSQQSLRYPVPVLNWESTPTLGEQMQYLLCETSRVSFITAPETMILQVQDYDRRVRLEDSAGSTIVSLTLPNTKCVTSLVDVATRPTSIELIAIAKGWSTWLGDDIVKRRDGEAQLDGPKNSQPLRVPGTDARDCYFVLWVQRVDGVSYRLASGEALATWWEGNREFQAAQIILG
ncbi:Fc.00g045000.m01.CDS01 [Cosmosporella sp. VM-42]